MRMLCLGSPVLTTARMFFQVMTDITWQDEGTHATPFQVSSRIVRLMRCTRASVQALLPPPLHANLLR